MDVGSELDRVTTQGPVPMSESDAAPQHGMETVQQVVADTETSEQVCRIRM